MTQINGLEAAIRTILSDHLGKDNAISRKALVERVNLMTMDDGPACALRAGFRLGERSSSERGHYGPEAEASAGRREDEVPERDIRKAIKHLVCSHGEWIGSCHGGYYVIKTADELESACKYYHNYAMSLLHVEAKLRKTSLAALLGQLSLRLNDGGSTSSP